MRIKDFGDLIDYTDKQLFNVAKKLKLDKINYNSHYTLNKVGQKNASPLGYPSKMVAIKSAIPSIFGYKENGKLFVRLYFGNHRYFFATSAILSFKQAKKGKFLIETENSFYEMLEE